MSAVRLRIRDWQTHCVVSRTHPAPERARADIDRLAVRLPEALAAALAATTATTAMAGTAGTGGTTGTAGDDGVVLVRQLDFDCALDLAADPDRLAKRWAARFADALAASLDAGNGVLRFPSVAAWRARFVADVVTGRPRQAWYYRAFDGLQSLPAAALVRTVLLEDAALGCATLAALPLWAWPAMSDVMTPREATRILAGLAWQAGGDDAGPASLLVFAATAGSLLHYGASGPLRGLATFAEALRGGSAPTRALAALCWLAGELAEIPVRGDGKRQVAALLREPTAAATPAERDLIDEARRLLAAHPEWQRRPARPDPAQAAGHEHSAFAALALLLPELDSLLDWRLSAGLPRCPHAPPRNLLAWLALAHCAGGTQARRFVSEGFWRKLFELEPELGLPELRAWLDGSGAAPTLTLVAERAATLARGVVQDAPLCAGRPRSWLRIDEATGIWCQWSDAPAAWPLPLPQPARLSAARRARRDWQYLSFDWGLPRDWQQVFVLLAQIAMRRFAWRLPGCAGSSLPWLHANLLAGTGSHDEAGRLRLTRPPLHALLALTGLSRSTIAWSGPPARQLTPEYPP